MPSLSLVSCTSPIFFFNISKTYFPGEKKCCFSLKRESFKLEAVRFDEKLVGGYHNMNRNYQPDLLGNGK